MSDIIREPNRFVTPNLDIRERIDAIEARAKEQPQVEIESVHVVGGGMFARTIRIPAGVQISGRIHRAEHINIMSGGSIIVITEEGAKHLTGFNIMKCLPGSKRLARAIEDTIWTTIIRTDETDLNKIEELFFAKDHNALEN